MSLKKKFKLIAVDEQNYKALRLLGHTPESFNDVVTKLLKQQQPLVLQVSTHEHLGHSGYTNPIGVDAT
jgi:predicted CopG family antitoxin